MPSRKALVYYEGKLAGVIEKNDTGYVFEYDPGYSALPGARPVSLTLPLERKRFESAKLFPFFEGLLPEGWFLNIASRALRINKEDKFELLLHAGKDTIGAISIIALEDDGK